MKKARKSTLERTHTHTDTRRGRDRRTCTQTSFHSYFTYTNHFSHTTAIQLLMASVSVWVYACVRVMRIKKTMLVFYIWVSSVFVFVCMCAVHVCIREEPFSENLYFPPSSFSILYFAMLLKDKKKIKFHWSSYTCFECWNFTHCLFTFYISFSRISTWFICVVYTYVHRLLENVISSIPNAINLSPYQIKSKLLSKLQLNRE